MTTTDLRGVALSGEAAAQFEGLAPEIQDAYLDWWVARQNRRSAHRDTVEAFAAGWRASERRGRRRPRRAP